MKLKIKNENDFVRDSDSNAVINTNVDSYNAYKRKRQKQQQHFEELQEIREDVRQLKEMLQQMIRGLDDKSN